MTTSKWSKELKSSMITLEEIPVNERDAETCFEAVALAPMALQWVPTDNKSYEAIALMAINTLFFALQHVPSEKYTEEMGLAAVTKQGRALAYVPINKRTETVCLTALKQTFLAMSFLPEELKNETFYLKAVKENYEVLQKIPENDRTPALCLAAVLENPNALKWVPQDKQTPSLLEAMNKKRMEKEVAAVTSIQAHIRGMIAKERYGIQHIPIDQLANWNSFIIGNDKPPTSLELGEFAKGNNFLLVGSSMFRSIDLACKLAANGPGLIMTSIEPSVQNLEKLKEFMRNDSAVFLYKDMLYYVDATTDQIQEVNSNINQKGYSQLKARFNGFVQDESYLTATPKEIELIKELIGFSPKYHEVTSKVVIIDLSKKVIPAWEEFKKIFATEKSCDLLWSPVEYRSHNFIGLLDEAGYYSQSCYVRTENALCYYSGKTYTDFKLPLTPEQLEQFDKQFPNDNAAVVRTDSWGKINYVNLSSEQLQIISDLTKHERVLYSEHAFLEDENEGLLAVLGKNDSLKECTGYTYCNLFNYFRSFIEEFGLEHVRKIVNGSIMIPQDWSDINTFKAIKSIYKDTDIVTYSSNIVDLAARFGKTPDLATEVGVLQCIETLDPSLSICSNYDVKEQHPTKHFVIDGSNHPLQIAEALQLQDDVKQKFAQVPQSAIGISKNF